MNTELLPFDVEAALAGADVVTVDGGTCTADLRMGAVPVPVTRTKREWFETDESFGHSTGGIMYIGCTHSCEDDTIYAELAEVKKSFTAITLIDPKHIIDLNSMI